MNLQTGIYAIIQARMDSTRLPGKVMMKVGNNKTVLGMTIARTQLSDILQGIVVATTTRKCDIPISVLAHDMEVEVYEFPGNADNVLTRLYYAAKSVNASVIVRVTGDCPLIDWGLINGAIQYYLVGGFDFVTNRPDYPDGMDVEIMSIDTLKVAYKKAVTTYDREHVTSYILNNPELFRIGRMGLEADMSRLKLSVDEAIDLERVRILVRNLGEYCGLDDIIGYLGFAPDEVKKLFNYP